MSDMDNEETKATQDLYSGLKIANIRKKNLMTCNEQELRMRCAYDEQYISILENRIKELSAKVEQHRRSYESRDIDEEFE